MKILEVIGQMINNYREMFNKFPGKVIIGAEAKRLIESELFKMELENRFIREEAGNEAFTDIDKRKKKLTYMGVIVEFDDNEPFVRLERESKK